MKIKCLEECLERRVPQSYTAYSGFHVAVRLFSNRSQVTSKFGNNKKVAYEATAECVTESDVLTTFWRLLWSFDEQTHGSMESICFL